MKKKIVFIRSNTYNNEPRLIKVSEAIKGLEKFFILWDRDGLLTERHTGAVYFSRVLGFGNVASLISSMPIWCWYCYRELLIINPDLVHACDIEAVMPAYIYSKIHKKKLIYDIWDATSGKFVSNNKLIKWIANKVDQFFIFRSSFFILPDEGRLKQLGINKRPRNLILVPNSVFIPKNRRVELNFRSKDFLVIAYTGVMSEKIRGLEFIAYAASKLSFCKFIISGYGVGEEGLKKAFFGLDNVDFLGKVSHDIAIENSMKSDLIISLLDPQYDNYKYATSTKSFEAFQCLKPIITTIGTATGDLIKDSNWGAVIPYNADSLVEVLKDIKSGKISFDLDTKRVQGYSFESVALTINEKYNSLFY